jgi:hypothetical protein
MNNYIVYYYLRENFSSPYYVGYGRPKRINRRHSRRNGAEILPPKERRWIVKSGLSKEEAIELEIKHIALWKREYDGGVLLNQTLGGEGKPAGQKTIGFTGRKHTKESRDKMSEKSSGKNNPNYGNKHSHEILDKMSVALKLSYENGRKNHTSTLYILTSPEGVEYKVFGELKKFCKDNNISYATMQAAIKYDRRGPRKNGWSIRR